MYRAPFSKTALRLKSASATIDSGAERGATISAESAVPIAKSLLAAVAGIGTVSIAAAGVEYSTASSVPAFDPKGQRFSQETFSGRFARMLLACDPRLLMYSQDDVRRCEALLREHEHLPSSMDRSLWEAKRVYESAVHPDTGDIIPRPFRMSGYVPYNGPICVAMVASQATLPLMFWSWANQSQNALVNYYNRNASSPLTNETLLKSYGVAVGSALAATFGLATFILKRYPSAQAKSMLRWVAFPSAVVASSLNCYIVRSPEIKAGIPLLNEDAVEVLEGETSQVAARRGVHATTASRALLQAPVYFLPPALLLYGPVRNYLAKNPAMTVPLTTYFLLVGFGVGLPATVAVFPQISKISADDVESRFHHLRDPKTNQPYEVFSYNKGL